MNKLYTSKYSFSHVIFLLKPRVCNSRSLHTAHPAHHHCIRALQAIYYHSTLCLGHHCTSAVCSDVTDSPVVANRLQKKYTQTWNGSMTRWCDHHIIQATDDHALHFFLFSNKRIRLAVEIVVTCEQLHLIVNL